MPLGFEHHRGNKDFGQYRIKPGSLFGSITIATSATPIRIGVSDLEGRHTLLISNVSANDIYVGFDNTVTTSNGIPIFSGDDRVFSLDRENGVTIFGISSASSEIRIMEVK